MPLGLGEKEREAAAERLPLLLGVGERLSAAEDEGGGERVEEREVCADAEPLLQGEGCD